MTASVFGLGQRLFTLGHGHRNRCGLGIGRAVVAHRPFGVHQAVHRDAAALGDLVVVEVMSTGDLHRAGAEIGVGIFIGDDRDQATVFFWAHRDFAELSDDWRVTLI